MAASSSGWGAGVALVRPPTERVLQLSDADVRVAVCERLGVPLADTERCTFVSRTGRPCGLTRRAGAHAHCCPGTGGARVQRRHNPLVEEFRRILAASGRQVALEQRDPTMGARAILDLYCREFFSWGLVQTDPNHGNFLMRDDGRIVLLDFGATLEYDAQFRAEYVHLLRTVETKDVGATVQAGIDFRILDPREPEEPRRLFAEMLFNAMEPFEPGAQPFVFRDQGYAERARDIGRRFTRSLKFSPPPKKLIFLHRKLGGIFHLLRRLDVQLDLYPYWMRMVGQNVRNTHRSTWTNAAHRSGAPAFSD